MPRRRKVQNVSKQVEIAERRKEALSLRLAGVGYKEIAEVLDVSVSTAHGDIQAALHDIPKAEADQLRQEEAMRLDRLQRTVWPEAIKGRPEMIDRAIRIIDRRARLFGLDAPTAVAVSSADIDVDAAVRALVDAAQGKTTEPEIEQPTD